MKILIPVLGFGCSGGYRVLSKLANMWIDNGVDVTFLTLNKNSVPYFDTKAKVDIFDTVSLPLGLSLIYSLMKMAYLISTRYYFYDAVIANRDITAYPVSFSRLKSKKSKFYYIQAYEPDFYKDASGPNMKNKIMGIVSRISYSLPLIKIVNSPLYLNYQEIKSGAVIPPGIDLAVFSQRNNSGHEVKEFLIVGCIGRKQAWKGTSIIAAAMEMLAEVTDRKIKLRIAFELPADFKLNNFKNIEIDFVTPHGDEALADFYRSVDVFIAMGTIQAGGYHYPSIEPLACGVPLISSKYLPANENNSIIINDVTVAGVMKSMLHHLNSTSAEIDSRVIEGINSVQSLSWNVVADDFYKIIINHKK